MATKIVTDKDGRMRTEDCAPPVSTKDVQRARKELRDMLDGNVQFHDDPRAAPKPAAPAGAAGGFAPCFAPRFCAHPGTSCDKCSPQP